MEKQIIQARNIEDPQKREDEIRKIRSVIKNAKRILSLRMLEEVDKRQEAKDNYNNNDQKIQDLHYKEIIGSISAEDKKLLDSLKKKQKELAKITGNDFSFEENRITKEESNREKELDNKSPDGLTEEDIATGYDVSDFDSYGEYIDHQEITEPNAFHLDEFFASGAAEHKKRSRGDIYKDWYYGYISGLTEY